MAATATLVFAKANHMRYALSCSVGSGEAGILAGATMLADAVAGPLKNILNVATQGYGKIAAGATITTAIARALLESADAESVIGEDVPTAMTGCVPRTGGVMLINVDTDSNTTCEVNYAAPAAAATTAYLDLYIPGAIGA